MRGVSSIRVKAHTDKEGGEEVETEFKLWDKLKALEILARHVGILKLPGMKLEDNSQQIHIHGDNPYEHLTDQALLEAKQHLETLKAQVETE